MAGRAEGKQKERKKKKKKTSEVVGDVLPVSIAFLTVREQHFSFDAVNFTFVLFSLLFLSADSRGQPARYREPAFAEEGERREKGGLVFSFRHDDDVLWCCR